MCIAAHTAYLDDLNNVELFILPDEMCFKTVIWNISTVHCASLCETAEESLAAPMSGADGRLCCLQTKDTSTVVRCRHRVDTKPNRYEVICHVPQCSPPYLLLSVFCFEERNENMASRTKA